MADTLTAVKGRVRDNQIVVDSDALKAFNGADVIITILDNRRERPKADISRHQYADFTTENINKLLEKNGQPEMLVGDAGLEAVREIIKNDVW